MKKLTRDEMKNVIGGDSGKEIYTCYSTNPAEGPYEICSTFNPAADCGYASCDSTGVQCTVLDGCKG